jgi:hypothetical protein
MALRRRESDVAAHLRTDDVLAAVESESDGTSTEDVATPPHAPRR